LDGEAILKTYRLAAGYLYEAHLRAELSRSLGVEWDTPRKGWSELKRVPRRVIDEFSTRRLAVIERMREQATSGFYAAQFAAVDTREKKEQVDLVALREDWRARAAEHGLGRASELPGRSRRAAGTSSNELRQIAHRLLGPTGLTEKRTAFSAPELVMAWADAIAQGARVERICRLCDRFVAIEGVERVGEAPAAGRPIHYSTSELMQAERAALELVERGRDADAPTISEEAIDGMVGAKSGASLTREQSAMVRKVGRSRDRVVCVVGVAGAGKTTAAHSLAAAFTREGIPVVGAAHSGVAAERRPEILLLHEGPVGDEEQPGHEGIRTIIDRCGVCRDGTFCSLVLERIEAIDGKAVLMAIPSNYPRLEPVDSSPGSSSATEPSC
jgi:hypothetical protein